MSYSRFCYIYIYVHTLRKQVLQSHKLDGCTLHRMVYSSAVVKYALQWFPLLCGVSSTGIPQPVDWLLP